MMVALCLLGEVISIQGAFSPNVEPFSSDGLQQPLEGYGQDGYGGKVNQIMKKQEFYVRPKHRIGAAVNWFHSDSFLSLSDYPFFLY